MSNVGLTACYFNPCGFKLRRDNYLQFYEALGDSAEHLVTVELAFGDAEFHLGHLPNRLGFRVNDVMWQKEALLNIGIQEVLNRGYEYVVWLDADISFLNDDWYGNLQTALPKYNLIQVFDVIKRHNDSDAFAVMKGTAASIGNCSPATGFGWGCPTSFFDGGFGLYSNLIIGGGDTLIYSAGHGKLKEWLFKRRYSLAHIEDIVAWSNEWYSRVLGSVGYASNRIDTFYHGDLTNRNYLNRHELLLHNEFDPKVDISKTTEGLLAWASDKPDMHTKLHDYFASRKEDG